MVQKSKGNGWQIIAAISFVVMVVVNGLANALPLNGQNTGQVSDKYPNLFVPAPYTFGIWGLIYLLLLGYTLFQLGLFRKKNVSEMSWALTQKIAPLHLLASLVNAGWIFAWHYDQIALSMALMVLLLVTLILIRRQIPIRGLTWKERLLMQVPFSIYFGWITVATIANATALLVSIGWQGFGLSDVAWTVIILLIGAAIAIAAIVRNRDAAYGLVPMWAYAGILARRTGTQPQYPVIAVALVACLAVFVAVEGYILLSGKKNAVRA